MAIKSDCSRILHRLLEVGNGDHQMLHHVADDIVQNGIFLCDSCL